jgi:hypothetical protein
MQIYYFYIVVGPILDFVSSCFAEALWTSRPLKDAPELAACGAACCRELRPRMKGGARQKPVEVGRAVIDTVRTGNDDLPALVDKGPRFGNSGVDAQADRRCGILASRGVYDESHGKPFLRDAFIDVTLRRFSRRPAFRQFPFQRTQSTATTGHQKKAREPASIDIPLRKSSSACFPARCAARCERKPPSHNLTPIGLRLRRISQYQQSALLPVREIAM